jgi:glycosyltransferase involved in cell wall biosynthesis
MDLNRSADALLLPVTDATANNAVLESLACGTPVISTRVGGLPDYVDDSCGWLLPVGDSAAMVDVIAAICAQPSLAEEMREAARAKALGFSWPVIAEAVHRLHASLLAGKRPETEMFETGSQRSDDTAVKDADECIGVRSSAS